MSGVKEINWQLQVDMTRDEAEAMAHLAKFSGNIKMMMKEDFPRDYADIDWTLVERTLSKYSRAKYQDDKFKKALLETLKKLEDDA